MIRVVVVDDQALVRAGVRRLLEASDDIEVVGDAEDGLGAIRAVEELHPDVVLMDIRMRHLDGIEAVRRIVRGGGDCPAIVMLTTFDLDEYLYDALAAGASGFLVKHAPPEELVLGVRAAAGGDALVSPALTRRLVARFVPSRPRVPADLSSLTKREKEILHLIIRGRSNAEIANNLFIGESTAKTHVARVLTKLAIRDRAQAVIFGYESGLVSPGDRDRE